MDQKGRREREVAEGEDMSEKGEEKIALGSGERKMDGDGGWRR